MNIQDKVRQQIVCSIPVRDSRELAQLATRWWVAIAAELVPLLGHDGFNVLFDRCLHLTRDRFPWLERAQSDLSFISLGANLAARIYDDAVEANVALLVMFSDLLSGLVGEELTLRVISAAWGDDAPDAGAKGVNHE